MFYDRFRSTGYMSNWAARLLARAIDHRLKPIGMSSGYMPVMFALAHGDALSQRALTEFAAIEQPTMAATLARMERDGLVVRRPDPNDRRAWLYTLSDDGKAKSVKVREAGQAINEAALSGLSQDERDAFLAALAKVVANLETYLEETRSGST
ncbi:MAG: MarR family winged helix-turn-helix transcriptional regulator [Mesorhizobium sp.]|nr:MarR family winged helix-turn-helix transcriptional regulator [Mesorhizobium sp.]